MNRNPAPLPFRTVITDHGDKTHLVVNSPALRGCRADQLPPLTLCGGLTAELSPDPVHDVQCLRCLFRTPRFMGMPAWEVRL